MTRTVIVATPDYEWHWPFTVDHLTGLLPGDLFRQDTLEGLPADTGWLVSLPELRRRVLADELSLAADVFDVEPVPLDDPLLGRSNVVHTPHNAGRTRESNLRLAEALAGLFPPY